MTAGYVMTPKNCTVCNIPLPLPRNARMKMHKVCRVKFWNDHRLDLPSWEDRRKKRSIRDKQAWVNMSEDNKAIQRKRQRIEHRNRREKVLAYYGGACVCCGETQVEFLAIDHVNGDGKKHREEMGSKNGGKIYLWLIRHNFPDGFQVLCHNCNMSKGFYGYCPHLSGGEPQDSVSLRRGRLTVPSLGNVYAKA